MICYKKDGTIEQFPLGYKLVGKRYIKVIVPWEEWFWSPCKHKTEYLSKTLRAHAEKVVFVDRNK